MTAITDPQEILEACKIIEGQFDTYLRVKTDNGTYLLGPDKCAGRNTPVGAVIQDTFCGVKMEGGDSVFVAGLQMKVTKDSDGFQSVIEDTFIDEDGKLGSTTMWLNGVVWVKVIKINQKYGTLEIVKDWKNYKYEAGI
jgi:hypothetical protein